MRTGDRSVVRLGLFLVLGFLAGTAGPLLAQAPPPVAVRTLEQGDGSAGQIAFSPDRKLMAVTRPGGARLWDIESGKPTVTFADPTPPRAIAFASDGKLVATGHDKDSTVALWDAQTGDLKRTLTLAKANYVTHIAFSPDAQRLAVTEGGDAVEGPHDYTSENRYFRVEVFGLPDGKALWQYKGGGDCQSLAFLPGGTRVICTSLKGKQASVTAWDAATGEQKLQSQMTHDKDVETVAVSPDGKRAASSGLDDGVKLWDAETGRLDQSVSLGIFQTLLPKHDPASVLPYDFVGRTANSLVFSPDGRTLACGMCRAFDPVIYPADAGIAAAKVVLIDMAGGFRAVLPTDEVDSLAFSADGHALAGVRNTIEGPPTAKIGIWNLGEPDVLVDRKGALAAGQKQAPNGAYLDAAGARVLPGDRLVITASSTAFRPLLDVAVGVETPDAEGKPQVHFETDTRAAAGDECRVDLLAMKKGVVQIVVTTQEPGKTGAYQLQVRRVAQDAPTAAPDGQWINGTVTNGQSVALTPMPLHAGQKLSLIAESTDFTPVLNAAGPTTADKERIYQWVSSSVEDGNQARLEVVIPADGTYQVTITGKKPVSAGAAVRLLIHQEESR